MIKSRSLIPKINKSSWVRLNVGGKELLTTKHTLLSTPSIFRQFIVDEPTEKVPMWTYKYWYRRYRAYRQPPALKLNLQAYYQIRLKEDGHFYIDRDPETFLVVLNFMRHGKMIYNKDVSITGIMEEACYFQVDELIAVIEDISGIKRADLPKAQPLYLPTRSIEEERESIFAKIQMAEVQSKLSEDGNLLPKEDLLWEDAEALEVLERVKAPEDGKTPMSKGPNVEMKKEMPETAWWRQDK